MSSPCPPSFEPSLDAPFLLQLRSQIEYYFSPRNLSRDAYLQQQLQSPNHPGAVAIDTIATFPKVQELFALHKARTFEAVVTQTQTPAVALAAEYCRKALEHSLVVTVSDDGKYILPVASANVALTSNDLPSIRMPSPNDPLEHSTHSDEHLRRSPVKVHTSSVAQSSSPSSPSSQTTSSSMGIPTHPLHTKERTTLIIRDIPVECTADEVLQALTTESLAPKSVRPDVGHTWYVTFANEAQAMEALAASHNKTIGGQPIRARLKNESTISSAPPNQPAKPFLPRPEIRSPLVVRPLLEPHLAPMVIHPHAHPHPHLPPAYTSAVYPGYHPPAYGVHPGFAATTQVIPFPYSVAGGYVASHPMLQHPGLQYHIPVPPPHHFPPPQMHPSGYHPALLAMNHAAFPKHHQPPPHDVFIRQTNQPNGPMQNTHQHQQQQKPGEGGVVTTCNSGGSNTNRKKKKGRHGKGYNKNRNGWNNNNNNNNNGKANNANSNSSNNNNTRSDAGLQSLPPSSSASSTSSTAATMDTRSDAKDGSSNKTEAKPDAPPNLFPDEAFPALASNGTNQNSQGPANPPFNQQRPAYAEALLRKTKGILVPLSATGESTAQNPGSTKVIESKTHDPQHLEEELARLEITVRQQLQQQQQQGSYQRSGEYIK